jgi:hypothetical protein
MLPRSPLPAPAEFLLHGLVGALRCLAWATTHKLVVAAIATVAILAAHEASADGATIPERKASLCERLGYPEPDCNIRYQPNKVGHGWITMSVDEGIDEPGLEPELQTAKATTLHLWTDVTEVSQTYQNLRGGLNALFLSLQHYPCATEICTTLSGPYSGYSGPSEADLADIANMAAKFVLQTGDEEMTAALQKAYNTPYLPVVTVARESRATYVDHTESGLASVFSVPVRFRFAIPYWGN